MENQVEIYENEPRCGSFIISEGFGREHYRILRLLEKYKDRFLRLENKRLSKALITRRVEVSGAGRPINEIMLNEKQAVFLGTLFSNTDKVLDFKEKLANDFVEQRALLIALSQQRQSAEWIEARATGKEFRRAETDVIKSFVEYAEAQGSTHANKYYTILTNCVNSNMFIFEGKFKNKREVMTYSQLLDVGFADKVVARALNEGMARLLPYKEVYLLVKGRMLELSAIYGKSDVIAKQLTAQEQTL